MDVGAKVKEIIAEQLNQDAGSIESSAHFVNEGEDSQLCRGGHGGYSQQYVCTTVRPFDARVIDDFLHQYEPQDEKSHCGNSLGR